MANKVIHEAIEQLKARHIALAQELNKIDEAVSALSLLANGSSVEPQALLKKAGVKTTAKAVKAAGKTRRKRAPLSPEVKAKMAEAARKRWAEK